MNFDFLHELGKSKIRWEKESVLFAPSDIRFNLSLSMLNLPLEMKSELQHIAHVSFKINCYDNQLFRLWISTEWIVDKARKFIYFSDHGIGVVFFKIGFSESTMGAVFGEVDGLADEVFAESLSEFFRKINTNTLV